MPSGIIQVTKGNKCDIQGDIDILFINDVLELIVFFQRTMWFSSLYRVLRLLYLRAHVCVI